MQLTDEQKRAIESWVFEGVSIKGIIEDDGPFHDVDYREAESAIEAYVEELRKRATG